MDPIISYIHDGSLSMDKKWARKLKCQAAKYTLLDGTLYRRGFTLPLLQCLDDEEANYMLREIHEGICGNHSGVRTLAFKALRHGYFYSSIHQDAREMTRNCIKLPKFLKCSYPTSRETHCYVLSMAFCIVESQPDWPYTQRTGSCYTCHYGHILFYKMGRG